MGLDLDYTDGQTPLDEDEKNGLSKNHADCVPKMYDKIKKSLNFNKDCQNPTDYRISASRSLLMFCSPVILFLLIFSLFDLN